jgi:hypothetical protein
VEILGYPSRLYKNLGNWKFKDVTAEVGLDQPVFYSHGCAVADYDNDGWPDLLVTGWGRLVLYHNVPGGQEGRRFVDVTQQAGLSDTLWSTSAAWADLDGDGFPDLFVCHYVDWSFANHPDCTFGGKKDICTPRFFKALPNVLYKNNGDGTFTDVSKQAGFRDKRALETGKSLGVVIVDLDEDGKPDIFVADDAEDSLLYLNQGGMKFREVGLERGVARDDNGTVNASMGVDAADFDGSGHFSLLVTNFQNEIHALYRNRGRAEFVYASRRTGIAALAGLIYVGWGVGFIDYDRDGAEDIFIANGHIMRDPPPGEPRRQKPVLLHNLRKPGDKPHEVKFENTTGQAGPFFQVAHPGRGAAFGDLDNDGKIDIVISHVNEPIVLLQNTLENDHHWLGIELVGKPYRDAVGAKLTLKVGNQELVRAVKGISPPNAGKEATRMDLQQRIKLIDEFLKANGVTARSSWGAQKAKITDKPESLDWDYDTIVIHHSGRSAETDPQAIQRKHMNKNGWDDVGYHFMVGPLGQIYEGRRLIYKGSHTEGANTGKIGILVMGNFEKEFLGFLGGSPSKMQIDKVTRLAIALKGLFRTLAILGGHKDFKSTTECPGNQLYPLLDGIRKATGLRAPVK